MLKWVGVEQSSDVLLRRRKDVVPSSSIVEVTLGRLAVKSYM